jgi:hypothetical protein
VQAIKNGRFQIETNVFTSRDANKCKVFCHRKRGVRLEWLQCPERGARGSEKENDSQLRKVYF